MDPRLLLVRSPLRIKDRTDQLPTQRGVVLKWAESPWLFFARAAKLWQSAEGAADVLPGNNIQLMPDLRPYW